MDTKRYQSTNYKINLLTKKKKNFQMYFKFNILAEPGIFIYILFKCIMTKCNNIVNNIYKVV